VIVRRTSRHEILAKLRAKVDGRKPILIASASNGLVARLLEKAGADGINTFPGARLRANGLGTMSMLWPILDSNRQTLDYTQQDILPAIAGDAFVCACINANDPLRDMVCLLEQLKGMGVYSVSNIGPSLSYYDKESEIYRVLTQSGITFDHEVAMLKLARQLQMVTVAVAFDSQDSLQVVEQAQPDLFCFHAGTTRGGLRGYDSGESLADTSARTEEVYQKVRKLKPDLILIAHGAGLVTPEDGQYILDTTSAHGIWTGSSTERIPIERAVYETACKFTSLQFTRPPQ
jgi:predicted TIM-barrel enzyme